MEAGLTVAVVCAGHNYFQIGLRVWKEQFSGATWAFTNADGSSQFASAIAGFPARIGDERTYTLRSRTTCANLRFFCIDPQGHAALALAIEDGEGEDQNAVQFTFRVEAAEIDRFTSDLCEMEHARSGEATLRSTLS